MQKGVADLVGRWAEAVGIDPRRLPAPEALEARFGTGTTQPPRRPAQLAAWERRHGFRLPRGLRAWLALSDGFYHGGPLVHPLESIGPMVPFARVPDLVIQPESWYEVGNPGEETVCVDLAYDWPDGDRPIFASGDDARRTRPRVIAPSFEAWFVRLLHEDGRPFWLDPGFAPLGDPWSEHCRRTPAPPLPARLRSLVPRVRPLMRPGADDRDIAADLGISRGDLEAIFRHLQHASGA